MAHSSWGPGWPNCQVSKINRKFYVDTVQGRVTFPGGIRNEIQELVSRLVKETANRGYLFGVRGNPSYGCWGFNCRAIGSGNTPSNHSWALAVDINAPRNPQGWQLITDMPEWMPNLWNAYGFRWGGDYSPPNKKDAMHYEFMGSVADAARLTAVARKNRLGEDRVKPPEPPTPPEEDEVTPILVRFSADAPDGLAGTAWMIVPGFRQRVKGQEDFNLCKLLYGAKFDTKTNNAFTNIPDQFILDHVDVATLPSV